MRKIFFIFTLISSVIAFAEGNPPAPPKKVGINTNDPKQTLDIKGTLGISQPGEPPTKTDGVLSFNIKPLYWNESKSSAKTEEETDQGKLVYGNESDKPFRKVRYNFIVSKHDEDWINGVDLGIDSRKYTVILMQYRLVPYAGKEISDDTDANSKDVTYLRLLASTDGRSAYPVYGGYATNRGYLTQNNDSNQSKNWLNDTMVVGSPLVYLFIDSNHNNWYFYADYPSTTPVSFNYKEYTNEYKKVNTAGGAVKTNESYIWKVDFLIVKNDLIKNLGEIIINESKGPKNISVVSNLDDVKTKLGAIARQ